MAYRAGTAFIQIVPSFKGFQLKLTAEAKKLGAIKINATVDLSTVEAERKIGTLRAGLLGLNSKDIKVGISDNDALLRIRNLESELARLSKTSGDAEDHVSRLGSKFKSAGDSGFDFGKVISAYRIPALVTGLTLASTAVASFGAAAIGAASSSAPLVGVYAALPATMIAVQQATGTLKLAFGGLGAAVTALSDPKADPKVLAQKLRGMSPAAIDLAKQLAALNKGPLRDLKQSLQTAIAPGFGDALRTLTPLFPVLTRQMTGTATVLGQLAREGARTMATPFFAGQLARIMGTNNVVIGNGGRVGIQLAHALLNIVDAFRPVLVSMSQYALRGATFINTTTRAGLVSGKLGAFFQRSWRLARDFGSVIRDVAIGLFNVGRESQVMGRFLGQGIAEAAAKFRSFTESTQGKASIKKYFQDSIPVVREFILLLRDTAKGLGGLSTNPTIVPVLKQIRTELLPAIQELAGGVTTSFGPALVSAATAFVKFNNALSFSPLATVLQTMADLVILVSDAVAHAPAPLNMMLSSILALSLGLKAASFALSPLTGLFGPLTSAVSLCGKASLGTRIQLGLLAVQEKAVAAAHAIATTATTAYNAVLTFTKNLAIGTRIQMGLLAVQTTLVSVAQKVAAVTSTVLSVGLRAVGVAVRFALGPVGLIIIGLTALAAGLIYAYKHSATFRNIVNGAWKAVQDGAKALFGWLSNNLVPFFTRTIPNAFQATVNWVKRNWPLMIGFLTGPIGIAVVTIIRHKDQIINGFRNLVGWATTNFKRGWAAVQGILSVPVDAARAFFGRMFGPGGVVRGIFASISNWATGAFKNAWSAISGVFANPVRAASQAIGTILGNIRTAFRNAVDAIGRIWDGVKAAARGPVSFVVNTVYNKGIVPVVNSLPGVKHINPVKFATGGVMPGYTPRRDVLHYYSVNGGPDLHLSGGEGIMVPEFTKAVGGARGVARLNSAARTGALAGVAGEAGRERPEGLFYASGGAFPIGGAQAFARSQVGKPYIWGAVGPAGYDCSGFMSAITNYLRGQPIHRRVGSTSSFPWGGFKPGPGEFTIGSTKNYGGSGVGHMAGTLAGLNVESRGGIGVVVGSRARSYKDHGFTTVAHLGKGGNFGTGGGGGYSGPSVGSVVGALNPAKWIGALRKMGGWGPMLGDMVGNVAGGVKNFAVDVVKKAIQKAKDALGNIAGGIGKILTGGGHKAGYHMAPAFARAAALHALPSGWSANALDSLWKRESGWRWNADNPTSSAYGIPQALPGRKMASAGSDWHDNALTQIQWGLGYIKGRYGNSQGAWAHSQRHGWYDKGGYLPPGLSTVYNGTGKPEPVFTSRQWEELRRANSARTQTPERAIVNIENQYTTDPVAAARALRQEQQKALALARSIA